MPGKLEITGSTKTPDPRTVTAYCEGRRYAKAAGTFTFATGITGEVANNNSLAWTSKVVGDGVRVTLKNPGTNNAALKVSVDGTNLTVSLATNGAGAPTSTAAEVDAAVAALPAAEDALVSCANNGASTGAGVVLVDSISLRGSAPKGLQAGSEYAAAFVAGHVSWTAASGGPVEGRDPCGEAYGGGI